MLRPSPRRGRCRALLVGLSGSGKVRSGRPSCRATLGQHLGIWRGDRDSGEVWQSARGSGGSQVKGIGHRLQVKDLVLTQKIKPRA